MKEDHSRNLDTHVPLLAVIIAAGTLLFSTSLLIGGLVLLPAAFYVPYAGAQAGAPLEALLLGFGSAAMLFAVANLLLGLSAAYGLYKRRPWGRVLAIIDSGISLISFPIGTILGAYGLWVLLPADAEAYFECCEDAKRPAATL